MKIFKKNLEHFNNKKISQIYLSCSRIPNIEIRGKLIVKTAYTILVNQREGAPLLEWGT